MWTIYHQIGVALIWHHCFLSGSVFHWDFLLREHLKVLQRDEISALFLLISNLLFMERRFKDLSKMERIFRNTVHKCGKVRAQWPAQQTCGRPGLPCLPLPQQPLSLHKQVPQTEEQHWYEWYLRKKTLCGWSPGSCPEARLIPDPGDQSSLEGAHTPLPPHQHCHLLQELPSHFQVSLAAESKMKIINNPNE